jgi:hypothetical protein
VELYRNRLSGLIASYLESASGITAVDQQEAYQYRAARRTKSMTDDLEKGRGIIDDRQHKLADVAVSLRPVPLRIRLIIAVIFIVGLLLVYLPSFADMNRSNGEYVQQWCHTDSVKYLDACK